MGRRIGRYVLFGPIASGGMATVHLGRLTGPRGFSRIVAVKRLHENYSTAPEFVASFIDEARIAARIRHPNVVPTLDVLSEGNELLLVLDYVHGESLHRLIQGSGEQRRAVPPRIAVKIISDVLEGLHAAHEATNEAGDPLGIVHRDVSPQNILVGHDGIGRVLDFGIAKAEGRMQKTRPGAFKGKLHYMAPEQVLAGDVTRRTDVFAASAVLWEMIAGKRLFDGPDWGALVKSVLEAPIPPLDLVTKDAPPALAAVIAHGLDRDPSRRFDTARAMIAALEVATTAAPVREVTAWVEATAGATLASRRAMVTEVELAPIEDSVPGLEASHPPPRSSPGSGTEVSLSLLPPSTPEKEKRRAGRGRGIALLVIVSCALILSAGLVVFLRQTDAGPPPEPRIVPSTAQTEPEIQPAPEPETVVPERPRPHRVRIVHHTKAPSQPQPEKAGDQDDPCDPPYLIDGEGIRHLKPQCM